MMKPETNSSEVNLKRKLDDNSIETEREEGDTWSSRVFEQTLEHSVLGELKQEAGDKRKENEGLVGSEVMDTEMDSSVFFKFPTWTEFIKEELRAQDIDTQCVYPTHPRHAALRIRDWIVRNGEGTRSAPLRYTMMNLFLLLIHGMETEVLKVGDLMELRIKWNKDWLSGKGDGT